MTVSPAINEAIASAEAAGNAVTEICTGWTSVRQDARMRDPLTAGVRTKLMGDPRVRYWKTGITPHNPAEEGFTDDVEKVAISFPVDIKV